MHEHVYQGAVNEAAKNCATDQKCELAAGQIVDRCRTERDDEVQDDSQHGGLRAPTIRFGAKDTAGNSLRNENGMARTIHSNRVDKIQSPNNQTTDNDGWKRARAHRG